MSKIDELNQKSATDISQLEFACVALDMLGKKELAEKAAAELSALKSRLEELEEYHGFYMRTIPEGEPTVVEKRLRSQNIKLKAELKEARATILEMSNGFRVTYAQEKEELS